METVAAAGNSSPAKISTGNDAGARKFRSREKKKNI